MTLSKKVIEIRIKQLIVDRTLREIAEILELPYHKVRYIAARKIRPNNDIETIYDKLHKLIGNN